MRNCVCCNQNNSLVELFEIKLKLSNNIKLNNNLKIFKCASCYHYFSDSQNNQDDYDDYYKNINKYSTEIIPSNKDLKCSTFLENFFIQYNVKTFLDYGCGNKILSKLMEKKYCVESYDIGMNEPINNYDCVILSHVLEHIYDVNKFMSKIMNYINSDGYIYIEVPNAEYYYEIKNICPLQEINLEHINFFTKMSLNKLMTNNNFTTCLLQDDFFMINNNKYYVIRGIFKKNINNNSFDKYLLDGINKISSININSYNNLYLYGCGQFLFKIFDELNKNNKIINIVDDDSNYVNHNIDGINIINFNTLKNKINDNDNVLITSLLAESIIEEKLKNINKNINIIKINF